MMPVAAFLRLPERSRKPRQRGITCVIDGGLPLPEVRAVLESWAGSIDEWKLGWGSAYLDPALDAKLELLRQHDVVACPGGTLLEVAAYQGRAEECLEWMAASGFEQIEVSDGLGLLGEEAKTAMIRRAAASFTVVSEVGQKHPTSVMPPATWVELVRADLAAGASAVIAEGRESGTVGMYAADGSARADVVDALLDDIGAERLVFEAPRKDQQAWLIGRVGPEVNLGNVAPREVLGLEALRLGLRADTMLAVHGRAPVMR
jgi:phosphosulfolactate synthase